jgi:predicted alpha/beta-fold hydrolase
LQFSKINLNLETFIPLVPIATGHTQTILGHIVPSRTSLLNLTESVLKLPDGDELLLQYIDRKSHKTLSLFHGLAGDANADYIRRSADIAGELGWNVVLVNHRAAHPKAKALKTYHSGRGEDASCVIEWARKTFPNSVQIALGFSMSGSILLNLLTERYGKVQPDVAVVVNAPLDLYDASIRLSKGLSKVYDWRFYMILKRLIEERGENFNLPALGKTIEIDDLYTSKVNGFLDAYDYYKQCSTFPYLEKIKTETFVLSSHDDPFIDVSYYLSAKWSDKVHLTLQKFGGHMGYFSKNKNPKYGRRWLDHYLGSVFGTIESGY